MPLITPGQAAELTGKHRSTIIRAIEHGRLSATRDELGHYLIDPAELERVYGTLRNPDERDASRDDAEEHDATPAHVAVLTREVELLREMLERERKMYERDRQAWEEERSFSRDIMEKQTDQLKLITDQREQERHSPSLFGWFRRRS